MPTVEPFVYRPDVREDERGHFYESYNRRTFEQISGVDTEFVQDNHSRSVRGVVRGLHYQLPPAAQGKLIRVVRGAIFDVVVDVRRSSPRFGEWRGYELTEANRDHLWAPPGYAHGFLVLSDEADVLYKTTAFYAPELERSIRWDDPAIGIEWPSIGEEPRVSARDREAPTLLEADLFD